MWVRTGCKNLHTSWLYTLFNNNNNNVLSVVKDRKQIEYLNFDKNNHQRHLKR